MNMPKLVDRQLNGCTYSEYRKTSPLTSANLIDI